MQRLSDVAFNQLCIHYAPELEGLPDLTKKQREHLAYTHHRHIWTSIDMFPISLLASGTDMQDGLFDEPWIDLDMPPSPWRVAAVRKLVNFKTCFFADVSPAAWAAVLPKRCSVFIRDLDIEALRIGRARRFKSFVYASTTRAEARYKAGWNGYVVGGRGGEEETELRAAIVAAGLIN